MYTPEESSIEHAPSPAFCDASSAAALHEEVISPAAQVEIFPSSPPAYYDGYGLMSAFQPIYCLYDGGIVGFEALARMVPDEAGDPIPAAELFAIAAARCETLLFDAMLQGVHIMSFSRLQVRGSDWLFLNVYPESASQAERCYLLDRSGRQHEANISRYEPVAPEPRCRERNPRGHSIACWATRPFCQIALDDPQHVHATGPLSVVRRRKYVYHALGS